MMLSPYYSEGLPFGRQSGREGYEDVYRQNISTDRAQDLWFLAGPMILFNSVGGPFDSSHAPKAQGAAYSAPILTITTYATTYFWRRHVKAFHL